MATRITVEHLYDGVGRQTGYRATVERDGKPDFDMDASYIFNTSGGVIGANVTKTYQDDEYQMVITKFCPSVGQLTGYRVAYNGQEEVYGICP